MMRRRMLYGYALLIAFGWVLAAIVFNRLFMTGIVDYATLYRRSILSRTDKILTDEKSIIWMLFYRGLQMAGIIYLCRSRHKRWGIPLVLFMAGFVSCTIFVLWLWNK